MPRTAKPLSRARTTPYQPQRPAYKPAQPTTETTPNVRSVVKLEPMIPVYMQVANANGNVTIGNPTTSMYMKALCNWTDNKEFEAHMAALDVDFKKKMTDKTDKHYLVPVFSKEMRNMIFDKKLTNTTWPIYDKDVFNEKTLAKNTVDLIYVQRDDSELFDAYFLGSVLFNVRNLIFKQNTNIPAHERVPSEFKYGTYFNKKGYKICTSDTIFNEEAIVNELLKYGIKTMVFEGIDLA